MASGSFRVTGTGQVVTSGVVLVAMTIQTTTLGMIELRNGDETGQVLAEVPSGMDNSWEHLTIPDGLRFPDGLHVTATGFAGSITLWV